MVDLRLRFWKRAAGLVEPLSERAVDAQVARGELPRDRAGERRGIASVPRPAGPLAWFHVTGTQRGLDLAGVMARMLELREDTANLLLTTREVPDDGALRRRLPKRVVVQAAPHDRPVAVERFVEYWQPSLCLWADTPNDALMGAEMQRLGIPRCLLPGPDLDAWLVRRLRPDLRAAARIFVADTHAMARVREAGVPADRVELVGHPREGTAAPEIDEAIRVHVARVLEARPLWLAARVPLEELPLVLDAQRLAQRQVHQLALIVLPEPGASPEDYRNELEKSGVNWTDSSALEVGGVPADVVLAGPDVAEATWYHLATVSYIGGSLVQHGGQSPQVAAALGSAVIHGPHVGVFSDIYARLMAAGAARTVTDARSLSRAVGHAIVPDRAARMAHAAWQVTSEGAEANDTIADALDMLLPDDGGTP